MTASIAPTARLRVLYVDNSLGFGGAIKSLALTLRAMHDVEPIVLTSQDDAIIATWLPKIRSLSFRRVVNYRTKHRLEATLPVGPLRWAALKMFALLDLITIRWNARRIERLIRHEQIALVHLNNGFVPYEALLAAHRADVPCVVHLRDFLHQPSVASLPAARVVDRVLTVSAAVADGLDAAPIEPARRVVVHDPVDADAIERAVSARSRIRAEWGLSEDAVAVAIFGRVIPWKGQLEFVQAMSRVMQGRTHVHAVIVGDESDGAQSYIDRVREHIASSGSAERFILAGYQSNVEEYYAATDVVVHASVTPEPFGMVVPEAMAAGKPVVAMDAGGPREIVQREVHGLLVAPGDLGALADAIARLADDAALRQAMGTAGRQSARERFSIEASAARVNDVYRDVMSGRRRS